MDKTNFSVFPKSIIIYLPFYVVEEKSGRAEESLGMSITAINETVMVTAPRWVDSQFSEYYRGRAYTFHNSGLQHWYNLIPCGNGKDFLLFNICHDGSYLLIIMTQMTLS